MSGKVSGRDATAYVALGSKVLTCLKGEALQLCCGRRATTLVQVLDVLQEAYGCMQVVGKMRLMHLVHTERYDPEAQALDQWVAEKHSAALKLGTVFATKETFHQNMMTVLLTLLPSQFDTVANQLRSAPPPTWQEVVARLRDYDSACKNEKNEVQGHVYQSLQKEVKELRALLTKTQKGGGKGNSRTKKSCYRCGRVGHLLKDCYSVGGSQKVQKNVRKGSGKGGKGF